MMDTIDEAAANINCTVDQLCPENDGVYDSLFSIIIRLLFVISGLRVKFIQVTNVTNTVKYCSHNY